LKAESACEGRNVPSTGRLVGAAHAASSKVTSALLAAPLFVYVHKSSKEIVVQVGDCRLIDTSLEYACVAPKLLGSSLSIGWKSIVTLISVIDPHAGTVIVFANELLSTKLSKVAHHT
jgi:hypothetical protein